MSKPKITVGIPFYNAHSTLLEAVRSIFAQTFTDWELILLDDGSDDGSVALAKKITDHRVQVLSDGQNKGLAPRLNQITRMARGQYIARMDADDMCDPGRLRTQVEYLDEHSEVDLVGSNLLSIGNNSRVSGRRRLPTTHEDICPGPLGMVQLCHPSVMFRKKWALAHPYPTNFNRAEDAALWQSSCHESRFANIPEPLFFYREYETFRFTKYYKSKLTGIKIMWTFGRKDAGLWQLVIGVFLRLGRIAAYGMLTLLGLQGIALAKRSQAAEADDLEKYQRALMIIRQTSVPGLSQED